MTEDIKLLSNGSELNSLVESIYGNIPDIEISDPNKYYVTHQIAEWGAGNPDQLKQDIIHIYI